MKKLFMSLFSLLLAAAFCLSSATPAAASENPAEKLPYFVYFSSEKPYNKYVEVCGAPFRKTIDEKRISKAALRKIFAPVCPVFSLLRAKYNSYSLDFSFNL